jgi:hypothetical protein
MHSKTAMEAYCTQHGHATPYRAKPGDSYTCLNCGQDNLIVTGDRLVEPEAVEFLDSREPTVEAPKTGIDATLAERGARYGSFPEHARITQNIKMCCANSPNWEKLPPDMREAIDMIAHKLGRILNGDPNYIDSWHDIIGYTKLVEDRLTREAKPQEPQTE